MHLESLTRNLRALRKAHGYTQEDMSKMLNIERQSYSNYETGRRIPNIEVLSTIADFLGVTVDFLIQDFPEPADIHSSASSDYSVMQLVTDYLSMSKEDQKEVRQFIAFRKSLFN